MRVLAFDTTGPIISVGAAADSRSLWRLDRLSERGKGNLLDVMIEDVLRHVGWLRSDVEGLALLTGPGSLTATRIGWATATGWAQAMGIPLTGWSLASAHRRALGDDARAAACCVHFRADTFLVYDLGATETRPTAVNLQAGTFSEHPPKMLTGPGVFGNRDRWAAYYHGATRIVDDADAFIGADLLAIWGEVDLGAGHFLRVQDSLLDYGLPPDFKKIAAK